MNYAIILSGGTGTRLGASTPKQYLLVRNRPIISYVIEKFANHQLIDGIVIVAAAEWLQVVRKEVNKFVANDIVVFANPGETRQLSIMNGLEQLARTIDVKENDKVIIHDAARPLVSTKLITECLEACDEEYQGVLPVLPIKDTVYQSHDAKKIDFLLNRNELFAGQAPETFIFNTYYNAHKIISKEEILKINGSTELAYKAGMKIRLIPGDPMNFKITDITDFQQFLRICDEG